MTKHLDRTVPPFVPFAWVYGLCVVVTHMIRSRKQDRNVWEYGVIGFGLGMLFGPFGMLFMSLFRDVEIVIEPRVKSHIAQGCFFGFVFTVTVVTTASTTIVGPVTNTGSKIFS